MRAAGREEVEPDARAGAGDAGDGEVAADLGAAVAHREAGMDELPRVDLVDADQRLAIRRAHQAFIHREGADGGGQVAAIALPIHHRPVHRDLGEGVVHIGLRRASAGR